jgi:hypothetical protein
MPCDCAAGERWAYLEDECEREMFDLPSITFFEWWLAERRRQRAWAIVVDTSRWNDYADVRAEQQYAHGL